MTIGDEQATGSIEFIDYHRPPLSDGDYAISVTLTISSVGLSPAPIPTESFGLTRRFQVAGERFALAPAEVLAAYPGDGSLGDVSATLPHSMLGRATLPWERRAQQGADAPWLALLLFDAGERPATQVVPLSALASPAPGGPKFPPLTLESGQSPDQLASVIDVPWSTLQPLLPSLSELSLLCHVRQDLDQAGQRSGEEAAVVIANRLPAQGAASTVHLVSLEGRYQGGAFNSLGATGSELVRLVSLQSWSFSSLGEQQGFRGLLNALNRAPSTPRLPDTGQYQADQFLAMGYVALPHHLRQGQQTVSWYHGPLGTGSQPPPPETVEVGVAYQIPGAHPPLPAMASDALLRYDSQYGLFDAGYAAAWQLGRLLAVQSKQFSTNLYLWRRGQAQQRKERKRRSANRKLALRVPRDGETPPSAQIQEWLRELGLLRGVPFNYLVPDERLLPIESLRFFQLDMDWVACLLDGAFSVGRSSADDMSMDQGMRSRGIPAALPAMSGLLLRSAVVSSWPGLIVQGYDQSGTLLASLRAERLSENVLLCLFEGHLQRATFQLKAASLHFGFDTNSSTTPPSLDKSLRDAQGNSSGQIVSPLPWRDQARRVLDVARLAADMQGALGLASFGSAQLAFQMIEESEVVAFAATD